MAVEISGIVIEGCVFALLLSIVYGIRMTLNSKAKVIALFGTRLLYDSTPQFSMLNTNSTTRVFLFAGLRIGSLHSYYHSSNPTYTGAMANIYLLAELHSSLITATTPLLKSFILEFKVVGQKPPVVPQRRRTSESPDLNLENPGIEKSDSVAPLSETENTPPKPKPKRHKVRVIDRATANRLAAAQKEDKDSDRTSDGDEIEVLKPDERISHQV
jgi:hypothetical protein